MSVSALRGFDFPISTANRPGACELGDEARHIEPWTVLDAEIYPKWLTRGVVSPAGSLIIDRTCAPCLAPPTRRHRPARSDGCAGLYRTAAAMARSDMPASYLAQMARSNPRSPRMRASIASTSATFAVSIPLDTGCSHLQDTRGGVRTDQVRIEQRCRFLLVAGQPRRHPSQPRPPNPCYS
jgi:hypothetical protein